MLKVTYSCGHEGHFPSWIPDGLEKLEDEGEIARALMVNGLIKATYQCAVCDLNHRPPSSASPLEWRGMESAPKDGSKFLALDGLGEQMVVHFNPHRSTGNEWQVNNLSAWFGTASEENAYTGIKFWSPLPSPPKQEDKL